MVSVPAPNAEGRGFESTLRINFDEIFFWINLLLIT